MLRFLTRRIAALLVLLFFVSMVVFAIIQVLSTDYAEVAAA